MTVDLTDWFPESAKQVLLVQSNLLPFKDGSVVGVDVGLESFATLSNGEKILNPRFFRVEEQELAKVQRSLQIMLLSGQAVLTLHLSAPKLTRKKWKC